MKRGAPWLSSTLRARDLDDRAGPESQSTESGNGGEIERRVLSVERDVEKGLGSGNRAAQRVRRDERRRDATEVPRPLPTSIECLYVSRNSITSRRIRRCLAGETLKALAMAAGVAGLKLRRVRFLAMPARY